MLVDAINRITALALEAKVGQIVAPPQEARHRYWIQTSAGMELREAEPCPREHAARHMAAFRTIIADYATAYERVAVWVGRHQVRAILDDAGSRRDSIYLDMPLHPVMAKLADLCNRTEPWTQKQFLRLLRVDLDGRQRIMPTDLIQRLQSLRFRVGQESNATIQQGRESMGKSIDAEVGGYENLPDEVLINVPVYAVTGSPAAAVRCALEVYPAEGAFLLTPMPDEIRRVVDGAVDDIAEWLRQSITEQGCPNVRVYAGAA